MKKIIIYALLFIVCAIALFVIFRLLDKNWRNGLTNTSIHWSNEWSSTNDSIHKKSTHFSGSEFYGSFEGVSFIVISLENSDTYSDSELQIFIDNVSYQLTIDKQHTSIVIPIKKESMVHSIRGIFYCSGMYAPCNVIINKLYLDHGRFLPNTVSNMSTIAILGDSISLIYTKDNYSSILSRRISYHLHNASVWGRSLAHTGNTSPAVDVVSKSLIPYKPNIVIVMLGTNDILENITESDFLNDYKKLIVQMHSSLPNTKIIVVSIFPGRDHQLEQVSSKWNSDMQSYFPSGVSYVDMTKLLNPQDYLDAIHPNISGQKKLADFLTKYLVAHKLL